MCQITRLDTGQIDKRSSALMDFTLWKCELYYEEDGKRE
jgi:hypothetical protein